MDRIIQDKEEGVIHVAVACRCGDAMKRMEINHEETKNTKKNQENLCALRFFVVDFRVSGK